MAGVFPDVPGVRIPYDVDGTIAKYVSTVSNSNATPSAGWSIISSANLYSMNSGDVNDATALVTPGGLKGILYSFRFPQPVNISGHNIVMYRNVTEIQINGFYYSSDTTDGTDGTWSANQTSGVDWNYTNQAAIRDISPVSWNNVVGVKLWICDTWSNNRNFRIHDFALYGVWASVGLVGWHPTLNQQIGGADLDVGDVALGTVHTKTFRIKNNNAKIANNVLVASTRGVASTVAGLEFSLDNTNWDTTLNITSIAAGSISPILYVRRTIGAGETANVPGIAQITFTAGSWT